VAQAGGNLDAKQGTERCWMKLVVNLRLWRQRLPQGFANYQSCSGGIFAYTVVNRRPWKPPVFLRLPKICHCKS